MSQPGFETIAVRLYATKEARRVLRVLEIFATEACGLRAQSTFEAVRSCMGSDITDPRPATLLFTISHLDNTRITEVCWSSKWVVDDLERTSAWGKWAPDIDKIFVFGRPMDQPTLSRWTEIWNRLGLGGAVAHLVLQEENYGIPPSRGFTALTRRHNPVRKNAYHAEASPLP